MRPETILLVFIYQSLVDVNASWRAVLEEQGRLGPKLEQMRIDGKTHSYQFKEMMGKKLMNAHLLALFKTHGIMD